MAHYVRLGSIPHKRHTQFRKPDGSLYSEQVFGTKGFSGIASTLYHINLPTQADEFTPLDTPKVEVISDDPLQHHHVKTHNFPAGGDPVSGRQVLLMNDDVRIGLCRPVEPMPYFYKNADGDDLLFVHEGSGKLETMFGTLPYHEGDYLIIPRGVIYRVVADTTSRNPIIGDGSPATRGGEGVEQRMLVMESNASTIEPPHRYRNEYGQLLEHAPYCERDIRVPEALETHDETGRFEVRVKSRGRLTAYFYKFHPLDVVGWDGFLYPWAINIADFEPVTGSVHQPPPTHQMFEAHNFVVCSFVPRMLDYHPDAVPIPYNHSNLDSDELLYYVNGNFASRKGIEVGSMTLHPSGIPHGPQPGAVEASLGKTRTEELAVMVDTFRPLKLTKAAMSLEDTAYPFSWKPTG